VRDDLDAERERLARQRTADAPEPDDAGQRLVDAAQEADRVAIPAAGADPGAAAPEPAPAGEHAGVVGDLVGAARPLDGRAVLP